MRKEDILQRQVAMYLRIQYPHVLWQHTANERLTSPAQGARLKALGVRAGSPDILIFQKNKDYSGLAIELKIHPNRPTESQRSFLSQLEKNQWRTAVCYSFEEVKKIIDDYLKR